MTRPETNPWLDAQLREVPVPDGLVRRLRHIALAEDSALDDKLRCVAMPSGLDGRLRMTVVEDDEGLDAMLRDVPVPYRVLCKLRATPGYRIQLQRVVSWAVAATLMVAIGLSYFGAASVLLLASLPATPASPPELAWSVAGELMPDESQATSGVMRFEMLADAGAGAVEESHGASPELLPPEYLTGPAPTRRPSPRDEFTLFAHRQPGGLDPLLDATPYRWGVFGSHEPFSEPAGWQESQAVRPRGIPAPTALAFDSSVLVRFGVFPFVPTAADASLQTVSIPMNVGTDSFELTRRGVAEGRLPPPARVRTEEFLAAIDYGFPKPAGKPIRLSLFGGASPFMHGAFALQAGVQAAELQAAPRPPVHLVLAVDASAGGYWPQRLAILRRALADLCRWLGPEDRISLVAFHRDAEVVAHRAGRDHAGQLVTALERVTGSAATNLGAGLTAAYAVANQSDEAATAATPLVVLFTDGPPDLPVGAAARMERRLAEAVREGVKLHVVALRSAANPRNVQLQGLADAGAGRLWWVDDARRLDWVLREVVSGQPQVVAEDVRLTFRFNPKAVSFYRMLGHEPGVKTLDSACVFHSGQAGTALFDIRLRENLGPADVLATAEVVWREPGAGTQGRETVTIRRGDLPATLIEAPLPLQAAVVAAEAGELLRRSVYTQLRPRPGTLAVLHELMEQLDSGLWQSPSFCEFAEVVKRAVRSKPYRGGG
ncbi:MAG: von Willebrand factor type A domain-containing protein [Patescibacteria group bacterium]|nr:von Willebrand factor type A domain-containing protein [Patescibacteria group bacterium]